MATKWSIYVDSYGKIVSELDDKMGEWVWHDEVAAIESRLADLEKDAARYRWLRDSHNYPAGPYWNDLGNTCEPEEMDEMIDEAMSREA